MGMFLSYLRVNSSNSDIAVSKNDMKCNNMIMFPEKKTRPAWGEVLFLT